MRAIFSFVQGASLYIIALIIGIGIATNFSPKFLGFAFISGGILLAIKITSAILGGIYGYFVYKKNNLFDK